MKKAQVRVGQAAVKRHYSVPPPQASVSPPVPSITGLPPRMGMRTCVIGDQSERALSATGQAWCLVAGIVATEVDATSPAFWQPDSSSFALGCKPWGSF